MNTRKAKAAVQDELSAFLDDVVELARSSTGVDSQRLDELKRDFRERVDHIQSDAKDTARELLAQADTALDRADTMAREKPWHFILAAGLVGVAMGVLVARK
jgi:ElaB/YqjD/DUF883 family membrane-anchored ribosome-binding protein